MRNDNYRGGLPQCQYFMSRVCLPALMREQSSNNCVDRSMHFEPGPSRTKISSAWNVNCMSGFVEAEREVLGELLERLDVDGPSVEIGERRYHRVLNRTETYTTTVGAVKVRRTLYRCGHERAVVPMELRAGMVEGHWTALAARQASCVVAQMTPKEGEALLRELGNMAPSKSSLDRLPKALSARWEASREPFESILRDTSVVPDEAVTGQEHRGAARDLACFRLRVRAARRSSPAVRRPPWRRARHEDARRCASPCAAASDIRAR